MNDLNRIDLHTVEVGLICCTPQADKKLHESLRNSYYSDRSITSLITDGTLAIPSLQCVCRFLNSFFYYIVAMNGTCCICQWEPNKTVVYYCRENNSWKKRKTFHPQFWSF